MQANAKFTILRGALKSFGADGLLFGQSGLGVRFCQVL